MLLQVTAQLSTHSNSLANQEYISVTAGHNPLAPASGATRVTSTLWHCPGWQAPPQLRCVSVCYLFFLQQLYEFKSLLAWVYGFLALRGDKATRLLSLTWLSSNVVPTAAAVSGTTPGDFLGYP